MSNSLSNPVTKFTLGLDCGKVINPRQLKRVMQGGLVMGLGEALKEEVSFDRSRVTSTDWTRYQIPTMQDLPEIEIVQLSSDDRDVIALYHVVGLTYAEIGHVIGRSEPASRSLLRRALARLGLEMSRGH